MEKADDHFFCLFRSDRIRLLPFGREPYEKVFSFFTSLHLFFLCFFASLFLCYILTLRHGNILGTENGIENDAENGSKAKA